MGHHTMFLPPNGEKHDNTKNGCLGDKEVGVGGGERGALIQIPFMALKGRVDIFF